MVMLGLCLSVAVLRKGGSAPEMPKEEGIGAMFRYICQAFNPMSVFGLMRYPNVLFTVSRQSESLEGLDLQG